MYHLESDMEKQEMIMVRAEFSPVDDRNGVFASAFQKKNELTLVRYLPKKAQKEDQDDVEKKTLDLSTGLIGETHSLAERS